MISPAPYLREKIFTLLSGNVTYNATPVPVYENEGVESAAMQIIIGDYSDSDGSNKQNFGSVARQVIQIINQRNDATRAAVDEVGEQVMSLIHPDPQSNALEDVDFSVCVIGKPSINHLTEDAASGRKVVRLILSYNLLIQNN